LTKTLDSNITITNLQISVNGYDSESTLVLYLRAHMGFSYVKNMTINNFTCLDGGTLCYMFLFNQWENIKIDGFRIKSEKDAINFETGHGAIIEHGILETFDDGFNLGCLGYVTISVSVGDVYDMVFRDIIDRTPLGQSEDGYMCRIMTASWRNWTNGYTYRTGDYCVNAGNLYHNNNISGDPKVGTVAPVHTSGSVTGADGAIWIYKQACSFYSTKVYNITFDNCTVTKARPLLNAYLGTDSFFRSVYPGTETLAKVYGVSIVNCKYTPINQYPTKTNWVIEDGGALTDIVLSNNIFNGMHTIYHNISSDTGVVKLSISMTGNVIKNITGEWFYCIRPQEAISLFTGGNAHMPTSPYYGFNINLTNGATLRLHGTDINCHYSTKPTLTPWLGDIVQDIYGTWIYKAGGWVNIAL
jgi:hypothetical protein